MFSQLFGKYLVEKGVISYDDYKSAVRKQLDVRVKLGTIAVAEGLLTEEQTDTINKLQMQFDKRFGDIAVEKGFLTDEQVGSLLKKQGNPYMQFLQVLLESGKVKISQMDTEFTAFQKDKGFSDTDMAALKSDNFDALVPIFAFSSKPYVTDLASLILRNINRFVSRDFYIGRMEVVDGMEYKYLAGQKTVGVHSVYLALAEKEASGAFLKIASAFAGEDFEAVDADVYDAVCEFINCNSGLFASEQSAKGTELDMEPCFAYENQQIKGRIYALPIYIEDAEIKLMIAVDADVEMGQELYDFRQKKEVTTGNAGASKGSVVVVDDSGMSRKILRSILEEAGYAVVAEAADGLEAVEAYKQYNPDIITLDITMPNLDGIGALKQIMEYDAKAKAVMITAAGQQQKIIEALKIGAEKFITKPFEKSEVISSIDDIASKLI